MQNASMELLWQSSHISGGNADYVEALYEAYLDDPQAVPDEWRSYFDTLPRVSDAVPSDTPHSPIREHFAQLAKQPVKGNGVVNNQVSDHERKQVRVIQLVSAYRQRGHQEALLDPLGLWQRSRVPDLELQYHQLSESDFDTVFQTGSMYIGRDQATLREIYDSLRQTYCRSIGAEFMHIVDTRERAWIQQRMESVRSKPVYELDVRKHLLERLTAAEGLEKSLGSKYPGTKRFGLEGGESLIPMLDAMIQRVGGFGAKEVVIGMAHRGRLNVLINILGKNPTELFDEFEGKAKYEGSADVKYHQGFSSNVMTSGGEVHLAMAFNPSHLEIVSPVVEGSVRARQDRREDTTGNTVVPIVMHGDAAFAGQGVVMETFQMSQTRAYKTGGTIHIVINNQVGFTTSLQEDARSTEYCTDVAKMVQAPIFHVNGDDPEAVLFVSQLAADYRNEFKKDVVIDLMCYRRRGHNEADEPSGTQPLMYKQIGKQKTTRTLYVDRLLEEGAIDKTLADQMADEYRQMLDDGKHVAKSLVTEPNKAMFVDWTPYLGHAWDVASDTRIEAKELTAIADGINSVPADFALQRQVQKLYQDRKEMALGEQPVNWGFAETLAYGSLLKSGYQVRITGQDVGRGTFSHRHAVLHSQTDASRYVPLQNLAGAQADFDIYDSLLSEEAVLAFEYGYSTTQPKALVIWEAQFGDFANGAQVVIDQFISSGELKWGRLCGLTMLLPHGYEGQGPEHSSARLERFMQLCAEHNIQVCVPSTPAQVFHMLRRQALRPLRRPLVVMSPKSLLRHKEAVSSMEELSNGQFQNVIDETDALDKSEVTRLIICSGKVYYDLRDARREHGKNSIAIVRLEQVYPFPYEDLRNVIAQYPNLKKVVWCQEEPRNQGAWYNTRHRLSRVIRSFKPEKNLLLGFVGRDPSASPAAGYMALHNEQLQTFIKQALKL
ncbi:2-oxoglutarate dehydrogenase E1 component [Spongiibacter sp. KMU-158]|uniref:2-oxoglutarate dehydrogenase E1 component n=1 Tax=Spongiibacter pelagi TaxID=2760804 RepID=A0A927C0T7_9GAMM|nr:2-oxoglutarate dehydrogenase E1 component [Spongiibacter pelagi]MBD2859169.1 2-oxoglutarate dehydrogenase E1 component [Spongiibacter pelagi]